MTVTEPESMSRAVAIAYAIGLPSALLAIVFPPVDRRLDWPPGWFFVAFLVVYGMSTLVLWRVTR